MKILLTQPLSPVSNKIHSHKAAQGIIYADQLKQAGHDVTVNMTGADITDYNEYEAVYLYHGNDWGGSVNMFGGVEGYANTRYIARLSQYKGKVYSIIFDMPKYSDMIKPRVDKCDNPPAEWSTVDWDNLKKIEAEATTVDPNLIRQYDRIAIGDSHAICMYRPGWMNVSTPFKTLYGALNMGFDSFIPQGYYSEIETYFGNIDIRHHLCRQEDPEKATELLVKGYIHECKRMHNKYAAKIRIWELLPIENESRVLPQTGYYKGTPFYGSWAERNKLRNMFNSFLKYYADGPISVYEWTAGLTNDKGELDFEKMEKPKSVHLSRASYPLWTGADWNAPKSSPGGLESFFQ
jgi:hypothetical protein